MITTEATQNWASRFKEDLTFFLFNGDSDQNFKVLTEGLPCHQRTLDRWLKSETPGISVKKLASFYRILLQVRNKEDFIQRCPEVILKEVLRYGEQYLDEIRFAEGIVDKDLFQNYFESDYAFRRVYYYLMAVNKSNLVSESYLIYKLGPDASNAIEKLVKSKFAIIEDGKIRLTEAFLDSAFDVRRIRSQIIKLNEEFATDEMFEEANQASMLLRIFGVNEEGHQKLLAAANDYIEAVNNVWMDKSNEGPIAIASTQSMLVLNNPIEEVKRGMEQ